MEFMDRINELCKERKISKRQLERDAGIGVGSSSKWKTFTPNNATMTKLANYFGVSISYLTGESEYRNDQEAQWAVQYDDDALKEESIRYEKGCRIPVFDYVPQDLAPEDAIGWEEMSYRIAKTGTFYGLIMMDDSMSPQINKGDTLLIKQQDAIDDGQIALVDYDGHMIRKIIRQDDGVILQPFNPGHRPIYIADISNLKIIGRVMQNRQVY